MIVGVAGDMDFFDMRVVRAAFDDCTYPIEKIITMGYPGVCALAAAVALERSIPYTVLAPAWDDLTTEKADIRKRPKNHPQAGQKYNHRAGIDCNTKFAEMCDAFILISDLQGAGVADIVKKIPTSKGTWTVRINP